MKILAILMVVAVVGAEVKANITSLNIKIPFLFSSQIDPRNIFYVGDQLLVEQTYGFWGQVAWGKGFRGLLGDVTYDNEQNTITIQPNADIKDQNGKVLSIDELKNGLDKSLQGTPHLVFKNLYVKTTLSDDKKSIIVLFKSLPKNFEYILTLADLAIAPANLKPFPEVGSIQTGPYKFTKIENGVYNLTSNPHYPSHLVAPKRAQEISISHLGQTKIKNLSPETEHLVYLYGQNINRNDLSSLEDKGYRAQINPHEWLVNVRVGNSVDNFTLQKFNQFYFRFLESKAYEGSFAEKVLSLAPNQHKYALKDEEVKLLLLKDDPNRIKIRKIGTKYQMGTLDEWLESPFMNAFWQSAKAELSQDIDFKVFSRKESGEMWNEDTTNFLLYPLGMGPSDPITTLSFLGELHDIVPVDEINKWASMKSDKEFLAKTKELFARIHLHKRIYPIGLFPGIVLENKNLKPHSDLQYGWGIQAWTYDLP